MMMMVGMGMVRMVVVVVVAIRVWHLGDLVDLVDLGPVQGGVDGDGRGESEVGWVGWREKLVVGDG